MSENKKEEEEEEEECVVVSAEDVEEGEISDSGGSVEEISEKDFAKAAAEEEEETNTDHPPPHHHPTRVWTMQDLYKYHHHTTTTSSGNTNYQISNGLYNLAWAQAVNNKPLHHQYLLMNYNNNDPHNSNINTSSSTSIVVVDNDNNNDDNVDSPPTTTTNNKSNITKEDDNKVFIEVDDDEDEAEEVTEKEEGELEEGEIDLDSEFAGGPSGAAHHLVDVNSNNEMEKQLSFIHQHLQTLPSNDRYKSFAEICSTLQNLLDSLSKMPCDNSVSPKHALVQKAFAAIQNVNHLFVSMNQNQKKHNKGELSRLFAHITHQNHPLFSSEQMKEIEVILSSLDSLNMSLSTGDNVEGKEIATAECIEQNKSNDIAHNGTEDLTSLQKFELDSMSIDSSEQEDSHILDKSLKAGLVNFKSRGAMLPLLDLHKDHDADSLPSPTRETPPLFPSGKALTYGNGEVRPEWPVPRLAVDAHNPVVHCYETDTLKAFSTYQQKFGRNTILVTNRLPSPTPSDDSDNGDGDTGGEISSSLTWPKVVNALTSSQTTVSSIPQVDICSGQGIMNAPNVFTSDCVTNSAVKSSVKSRDPRLRLSNSNVLSMEQSVPYLNNEAVVMPLGEVTNSRKQKIIEESAFHGPALKRQRNDLLDFQAADNVKSVSGHVGWLDDRGTAGFQVTSTNHLVGDRGSQPWNSENVAVSSGTNSSAFCGTNMEAQCAPVTGASTTASVNSLLKNIAVNPAAWLNIFQMGPQKNADPASVTNQPLGSNGVSRSLPSINSDIPNIPFPKQISAGTLQPPQTASSDEFGKLRMKPRDPRRALQNNISHKGGNLESGQAKIKNLTTQEIGNLNVQKQDQLKKSISTQSSDPPDIASLFTKNLKNIANIMSVSQTTTSPSAVSQISSTKPIQVPSSSVGSKGVLQESSHQPSESSLPSEATAGPSQSQNTWGEVEHLFKGFDDRQKADIQKERARRLEEQNNMFAAHKLCLVLDLDHTLLNSAKFSEIDPLHDELLRKKEEQDREKPQRHLFRFPHMGMWTKLRPGIWNFLEKASKLFEMHLYTMGNKLYATEMAKVLDPKGVLFAGRVISKGDDGDISDGDDRVHKTKDLEGVLGMESAVVIIDDSLRVWPHNKLNLIVVERYIYFPCSRRQFGLPGPSLLEIDHDERSENGTLASSLGVIERIHQNFFSSKSLGEADVRNILAAEQHKILDGCRIVFSRVFPVGEANPHLHPLWQTAEQFGAVCTNQIDEQVTHVVANSMGTDKVNWALSTGRFVVHPGWVEASALLYRRASEQDFAIKS